MKKKIFLVIIVGIVVVSCTSFGDKLVAFNKKVKLKKIHKIVYFNPEIIPNIEEIKPPTNDAFFGTTSNQLKIYGNGYRILRVDTPIKYDNIDSNAIRELCVNNNAEIAIIPKIKYFKVGLGKYVFSNQVVVSLKLYNDQGDFVMETSYDTYKANARLLGNAENSIKIGTKGAMKTMIKELRNRNMMGISEEN